VRHGEGTLVIVGIGIRVDGREVDDGVGAAEGRLPCAGAVGQVAEHHARAGGHALRLEVVGMLEEDDAPLVRTAEEVRCQLAAEVAAL